MVGQGTPEWGPYTQAVGLGAHLCEGLDSKGTPCSQGPKLAVGSLTRVPCALGRAGCGGDHSVSMLTLGGGGERELVRDAEAPRTWDRRPAQRV